MAYLIALLVTVSVALLVFAVGALAPARSSGVQRRLAAMQAPEAVGEEERPEPRERFEELLEGMGEKVLEKRVESGELRARLVRAGYYAENAVPLFYGIQLLLLVGCAIAVVGLVSIRGLSPGIMLLMAAVGAMIGWILPRVYLSRRIRRRHRDIQRALPDTLDLLVVCVEAGLGLNQALLRVSEEISYVSRAMRQELQLVNLEIRAGTPRDEALRNFGERTGVADVRTLTAMLVQTDRFGTSVARSLRVHSDTMRTKRRQRAEEAAAKTTIKLVFPLVLFIFPSMFVVILGPAILHILQQLKSAT